PAGAEERRGTPQAIDVAHLFGNFDPPLLGDLLLDQLHREQRGEVVRPDRLAGAGVQHRGRRGGQVGDQVVPVGGDLLLGQQDFRLFHGGAPFPGERRGAGGRVYLTTARVSSTPARAPLTGVGYTPHRAADF